MNTLLPSIQRGSTIILEDTNHCFDGQHITYGRSGLETQRALADALATLEGGVHAKLFPSGLASISATLIAMLSPGDEILLIDSVYGRTRQFCKTVLARLGISCRFVPHNLSPDDLPNIASEKTRVLFLESPASITFEIQDISALTSAARNLGIISIVDNTWSAGELFKPLKNGADISLQSLTKYVGGHSDCFMGCAVFRDLALADRFAREYDIMGWATSPDDTYLMIRGLKTLRPRLALHAKAVTEVAEWLKTRKEVEHILCPMLDSHPSHSLWKRDFSGHNGLLSIVLSKKYAETMASFLNSLKIFRLGFSWGGFESLALDCTPQIALRTEISIFCGPVIRLHVGLEDEVSLIEDLEQAFHSMYKK